MASEDVYIMRDGKVIKKFIGRITKEEEKKSKEDDEEFLAALNPLIKK